MSIKFEGIGFWLRVFGLELECYIGGLYLRIPSVFELAWNRTGFYFNRI